VLRFRFLRGCLLASTIKHPASPTNLSPISKSTTQVFKPLKANPIANNAADVVLPTPPLPDVMQTILPLVESPSEEDLSTSEGWESTNGCDVERYRDWWKLKIGGAVLWQQ
jgi:hypothetical protein